MSSRKADFHKTNQINIHFDQSTEKCNSNTNIQLQTSWRCGKSIYGLWIENGRWNAFTPGFVLPLFYSSIIPPWWGKFGFPLSSFSPYSHWYFIELNFIIVECRMTIILINPNQHFNTSISNDSFQPPIIPNHTQSMKYTFPLSISTIQDPALFSKFGSSAENCLNSAYRISNQRKPWLLWIRIDLRFIFSLLFGFDSECVQCISRKSFWMVLKVTRIALLFLVSTVDSMLLPVWTAVASPTFSTLFVSSWESPIWVRYEWWNVHVW